MEDRGAANAASHFWDCYETGITPSFQLFPIFSQLAFLLPFSKTFRRFGRYRQANLRLLLPEDILMSP